MYSKKRFIVFILLTSILFANFYVQADDYLEEENSWETPNYIETSSKISDIPQINARHAIIYDRLSRKTLFGKNEKDPCKMASTTKIMSSLIVLENVTDLSKTVTISKKAASIGGSRLGLSTNDEITVENLLYGLMLCSGNDDAVT